MPSPSPFVSPVRKRLSLALGLCLLAFLPWSARGQVFFPCRIDAAVPYLQLINLAGATQILAAANPTNPASNPEDGDGNGLADAWERQFFGHLGVDPAADPDDDWFTNAQESAAGTDPGDRWAHPAGPKTRLIPVDDGDATTSEYGYAATDINSISYIRDGLRTVGDQQFLTYYGRHQTDATYAYNNTLWIARRTVGAKTWEVFRTVFTANAITDDHDTIAFGIDGEGFMHLSWGMHNATGTGFHYSRSTTPVTGTNAIAFPGELYAGGMTGNEKIVTYPQFLTLPNGDLLYLYRVGNPATGGAGSGDTYLNRWQLSTHRWTNVHVSGTTAIPFIKGAGWSPDYNAYHNQPCIDALGNLLLTWTWRFTPDYQTNQDMAFAKSSDFGVTWQQSNGRTYALPISKYGESGNPDSQAENVLAIAQGSSLINQAGMCLDEKGQPVIATWWAPGTTSANTGSTGSGDYRRQYMVAFPAASGTTWATRQVSNRTLDPRDTKISATYARDLGRPIALCDRQGRILVLYRDNHPPTTGTGAGGLTVAYTQTAATDPHRLNWTTLELTHENLGASEPVIDLARWERDNVLSVLYQPTAYTARNRLTYSPPANSASRMAVFEWDEAAYFALPTLEK